MSLLPLRGPSQEEVLPPYLVGKPIDLYSASSNLGDNLSLTAVMRAAPCRVHLIDDEAVRSIAPLFDGLGEVVYDNDARWASAEAQDLGPHSAKLLRARGLAAHSAIPSIQLTDTEVQWARHFLTDGQLTNCCIIKSSTQQPNYRTPPPGLMDRIIEANPDIQFITSALSSSHAKHNFQYVPTKRTLTMWDYPVRKLAAIYHVVGRYVGPDTGDMHLMLSVGGKVDVLVPDSRWDYDHNHFHYRLEDFVGEVPRARYHRWTQPLGAPINDINLPSNL